MMNKRGPGMGKGRVYLWGGSENTAVRFALVGLTCAASATLAVFAFQPGNRRPWRYRVMNMLLPWQRSFQHKPVPDQSGIILSSAIERSARDRALRNIGIFFLDLQDLRPGTTVDEIHAIYEPQGLLRSWSSATPAFGSQGLLLCLVVTREKRTRQEDGDGASKGPTRYLLVELSSEPLQRKAELRMFERLEAFSKTPRWSSPTTKTSEPTPLAQDRDESTYLATIARFAGGYRGLLRVGKGEALKTPRRKSRGGARKESGASDPQPFDGHRGDGMDDAGRWFAALEHNRAGTHWPCTLTVRFTADAVLRPNSRQGQTENQGYPDHSTAGFRFGGISWEGTAWNETLGGASSGIGGRIRMSHGEEWGRSLHPDAFGTVLVRFFHDGTQLRTGNIISTLSQLRVLIRCFRTSLSDEHATDDRETDSKDAQLDRRASPGVGDCNSCGFHPATVLLAYDSFDASEGIERRCTEVTDNIGDVALHGSRERPFTTRFCPPPRRQGVVARDTYRNEATVEKTTVRIVGFEACAGSLKEVGGARSITGDSNFSAGRSTPQQCSKCKVVLHGLHRVVQLLEEILDLSSVLPAHSPPERFSDDLAHKPFATSCTKSVEKLPAKDPPAPNRLSPSEQDNGLPSEESKERSASDPSRKAMPASAGSDNVEPPDVDDHAAKGTPETSAPRATRSLPGDRELTPPSSVADDPEPDPHIEQAFNGTRHDQMSAQESCEVSELGDMREERDPAPTEFGDEPYPDRHGLADEEERLIVEITEMSRRLPRLVHEVQTDVRTQVGRKVMAESDATAEIGGDDVSKASALGGLDVKDYSLMAVLGCWKETVEALDLSARELQYHRDAEKEASSAIWAALEATMASFRGQVLVMSVKNAEWLASKVKLCQPPEKAAKALSLEKFVLLRYGGLYQTFRPKWANNALQLAKQVVRSTHLWKVHDLKDDRARQVFKEAHLFVKSVIVRIAGEGPAGARWQISEQNLLSIEKHRPHLLLENMRLLVVAFDNMKEEDRQQIATVKEIVNNRDCTGASTARQGRSERLTTESRLQRTASMDPEVAPTPRGSVRRGLVAAEDQEMPGVTREVIPLMVPLPSLSATTTAPLSPGEGETWGTGSSCSAHSHAAPVAAPAPAVRAQEEEQERGWRRQSQEFISHSSQER